MDQETAKIQKMSPDGKLIFQIIFFTVLYIIYQSHSHNLIGDYLAWNFLTYPNVLHTVYMFHNIQTLHSSGI